MSTCSWFRELFARPAARPPCQAPARCRPSREAPEDRRAPATSAVTTLADSGAGWLRQVPARRQQRKGGSLRTGRQFGVAVLGAALALLAGGVTHAGPVLGISAAGVHAAFRGGDETAGWSFTTSQAITVTALDAFDPSGYGNVRLYDGIGDVLASATLTTADPTEAAGSYWFYTQAITPVTLQAGQTYYVAEDFKVGVTHALAKAVLTTSPLITYGDGVGANGAGWTPTRDNNNGAYNPSYFGPNFDAAPAVSAAPEPASLALLATGALGLLGYGWRRRQAA